MVFTLVLQIPNKAHFQIIGRGARTIRNLQSTYKCKIHIPHKEDDRTDVKIEAGSEKDAKAVQSSIERIIGFEVGTKPLKTKLLDVPARKHGALIGRGGSTLSKLERESQCNINVPRRGASVTYVEVEGPAHMIEIAHKLVERCIGFKVKELDADATEETKKAAEDLKKIDITSKPIFETLMFPDHDKEDGWNFDRFIDYLSAARESLDICIFTITENRIARVIQNLHKSGVKVRIITDNLTAEALGSDTIRLKEAGVPLKMDKTDHHMHHKFCVIDDKLIISGSFNWTRSASLHNHENVMITNQKDFVEDFVEHFKTLWHDTTSFE